MWKQRMCILSCRGGNWFVSAHHRLPSAVENYSLINIPQVEYLLLTMIVGHKYLTLTQ